jgi:hypothetical protein
MIAAPVARPGIQFRQYGGPDVPEVVEVADRFPVKARCSCESRPLASIRVR